MKESIRKLWNPWNWPKIFCNYFFTNFSLDPAWLLIESFLKFLWKYFCNNSYSSSWRFPYSKIGRNRLKHSSRKMEALETFLRIPWMLSRGAISLYHPTVAYHTKLSLISSFQLGFIWDTLTDRASCLERLWLIRLLPIQHSQLRLGILI